MLKRIFSALGARLHDNLLIVLSIEPFSKPPLCDIQSICGFFTGPWTVTRLFFTA